jgi:hypothetical protein
VKLPQLLHNKTHNQFRELVRRCRMADMSGPEFYRGDDCEFGEHFAAHLGRGLKQDHAGHP